MKRAPIDDHLPPSMVADLGRSIAAARRPGVSVRLVKLPHDVLGAAFSAVIKANPYSPFRPTVCGIPCDFAEDGATTVCTVTDTADQSNAVRLLNHKGQPLAA